MTIQDWGAIGEIIGAIAVVASLIYLAVQIRQNTAQIARGVESDRFAAFERNAAAGNRWRRFLLLNPRMADLYNRGIKSYRDLNSEERFQFGLLIRNTFSDLQVSFVRNQHVGNDMIVSTSFLYIVENLLANPGVREWLQRSQVDWRPEFRAIVDEVLEEQHRQEVDVTAAD